MEDKKEILVETSHLSINFPVKKELPFSKQKYLQAVTDVSIQIHKGETFGLVGESGCGKSTFANATLGLLTPDFGRMMFAGQDLNKITKEELLKEIRKRMQKIFQDPGSSLNPRFTVFELIAEPLVIRGGYTLEQRKELVIEMLENVGLSEADLYRYPCDFSGGQQKRIAIARALILNPEYLVCDEPVSALDVSVHAQILNLLMNLQKKMGITYLFISHNLAVVKKICDRLAIMYLGKVVEYGSAEKIFANPMHPYTKALMSAVLDIDVDSEKVQNTLYGDIASSLDPPTGCRFCKRCPEAKEDCSAVASPLVEVELDHYVACRFAHLL
ncbi:MAG: oligopeptide/dipeptide ABC transporter ATP-binding protein [Schaedlerella sp.]|nr:oligopeptide/dipeptide ABC transporter ATP-binding protein [Schaedlerella sp.]